MVSSVTKSGAKHAINISIYFHSIISAHPQNPVFVKRKNMIIFV
jgi:hypothetical protein